MTLVFFSFLCVNANAFSSNRIGPTRLDSLTAENAINRINGYWTPHYVLGEAKMRELSEMKQQGIVNKVMERADDVVRLANLIDKKNEDKLVEKREIEAKQIIERKQEEIAKNKAKEKVDEKAKSADLISNEIEYKYFLPKKLSKMNGRQKTQNKQKKDMERDRVAAILEKYTRMKKWIENIRKL
jgi:hypothetical protein